MRFLKMRWDAMNACPTAERQTFKAKTLPLTADPAVIDSTEVKSQRSLVAI